MSHPEGNPRGFVATLKLHPILSFLGFGGVVTILGWLWSIVNPVGAVDLSVSVENEVFFALPADMESLPLRIAYDDQQIRSALVFDAVVVNTGSQPIGEEHAWTLKLQHPEGLRLVQLGDATTRPEHLADHVSVTSSDRALTLQLGLLNRDEQVRLKLMALEHPNEFRIPLQAIPSRVARLSEVPVVRVAQLGTITHQRIQQRIGPPLLLLLFVGAFGATMFEEWKSNQPKPGKAVAQRAPILLFVSVLASGFSAMILSWLLAWLGVLLLRAS